MIVQIFKIGEFVYGLWFFLDFVFFHVIFFSIFIIFYVFYIYLNRNHVFKSRNWSQSSTRYQSIRLFRILEHRWDMFFVKYNVEKFDGRIRHRELWGENQFWHIGNFKSIMFWFNLNCQRNLKKKYIKPHFSVDVDNLDTLRQIVEKGGVG